MGKLQDFRRHFPPIMAWTSLQGDSISQDGPQGWGVVNLEKKKRGFVQCPNLLVSR